MTSDTKCTRNYRITHIYTYIYNIYTHTVYELEYYIKIYFDETTSSHLLYTRFSSYIISVPNFV